MIGVLQIWAQLHARLAKNVTLTHFKTHTSSLRSGPIYEAETGGKTISVKHIIQKIEKKEHLSENENYPLLSSNSNHGKLLRKVLEKLTNSSGTRQKKLACERTLILVWTLAPR